MSWTISTLVSSCLYLWVISSCIVRTFWRTLVDQHKARHFWYSFGIAMSLFRDVPPSNSALTTRTSCSDTIPLLLYKSSLLDENGPLCTVDPWDRADRVVYHGPFKPLFFENGDLEDLITLISPFSSLASLKETKLPATSSHHPHLLD